MRRLAVIPTDPIGIYLKAGYSAKWLREYFNPLKFFDEVYVLSPNEPDNPDLLGMKAIHTQAHELAKRLKQLKIDVVRAYGGFYPCGMACGQKVNGIPVVVSVHDTNPSLLWDDIKNADAVFAMTYEVKRLVGEKHPDPKMVWVLPNRIHFDYMRPYSKKEIGTELDNRYPFKYRLIHVGRRSEQKNLDNIIKSLQVLGPDYCLLAVGRGDPAPYQKIAAECGVLKQCFFIESIPNEELPKYYSWADCVYMPSRWEGFGIVIAECLAAGAVLVTSKVAPMTEFVSEGVNGLLVEDYENPQALAATVKTACTDQSIRQALKRNARSSVECFEQSKVDALEVEYYRKVLELNAQGAFKMSLKERLRYSAAAQKIKAATPEQMRKALTRIIKGHKKPKPKAKS